MAGRLSLGKRLVFSTTVIVAFYLVVEAVATGVAWWTWWDTSFWLFEDSGRTCHFDAIRGYRLTRTPSRFLRATNGSVEFVGTSRGNALGFADRDDFGPKRTKAGVRRIAVFGDSFTEAQYLGQNWPDRAEDLARAAGKPLELLNFAVSGGGLANWWSVLTRLVDAEDYDLDGVVFVVFAGDLRRKFSVYDHSCGLHPLFGRTPRWDPKTYPDTLADAKPFLEPHPGLILSPEAFERALQGHWPRSLERRLRPFFLTQAWHLLRDRGGEGGVASDVPKDESDPDRERLIADIGRVCARKQLPVWVVSIPGRPALLAPDRAPRWPKQDAAAFARVIGATFLDGGQVFARLRPNEIRALFLPHDGHWNQAGSNRFAGFIVQSLDRLDPNRSDQSESAVH